jgi:hypothetical protein
MEIFRSRALELLPCRIYLGGKEGPLTDKKVSVLCALKSFARANLKAKCPACADLRGVKDLPCIENY